MTTLSWDFEPRTVRAGVSVRATLDPSLGSTSISLPWFDASGQLSTTVTTGPLSGCVLEVGDPRCTRDVRRHPGSVCTHWEQAAVPLTVNLELVRRIQRGVLPISVSLARPDGTVTEVASEACVHLGPLLVRGSQEKQEGEQPPPQCSIFASRTEGIGLAGLYRLEVHVWTEGPLLSQAMRERLLPACFTVGALKGLPNEGWLRESCGDVYVRVYPQLSPAASRFLASECRAVSSKARPHDAVVRIDEPVVWLLGLAPHHVVREWLHHEGLIVEVHDRDPKPASPPTQKEPEPTELADKTAKGKDKDKGKGAGKDKDKDKDKSKDKDKGKGKGKGKGKEEEEAVQEDGQSKPGTGDGARPRHQHGVARFPLAVLLGDGRPEAPLRADVFPVRSDLRRRRAEVALVREVSTKRILGEGGGKQEGEGEGEGEGAGVGEGSDGRPASVPSTASEAGAGAGAKAKAKADAEVEAEALALSAAAKNEDTPQYHEFQTCCTLFAALGASVAKADTIETGDHSKMSTRWGANEERASSAGNIWVARPGSGALGKDEAGWCPRTAPHRAKLQLPSGEIVGPWRAQRSMAEADDVRLRQALGEASDVDAANAVASQLHQEAGRRVGVGAAEANLDCRFERYGRIVLVVGANETSIIKPLLQTVREHNARVLEMDPTSVQLDALELTDEQKTDPHLDLITGFALLDGRMRLMVIEGLRGRGLQAVLDKIPRKERSNSEEFKLLHNPDVGFNERIYGDFGGVLRQIKIRFVLEDMGPRPELFAVTGLKDDDMAAAFEAPKLLLGLKHAARLKALRTGGAFPSAAQLVQLNVLYGEHISDEERRGEPEPEPDTHAKKSYKVQAARNLEETMISEETLVPGQKSALASKQRLLEDLSEGPGEVSKQVRVRATRKGALDMTNPQYSQALEMRRSCSLPDFAQKNRTEVQARSEENIALNDMLGRKRERETPFLDGKPVHIYSGQRLNCAEQQKDWMRRHMDQQDDSVMWTYNPVYGSCAFEYAGARPPGELQHEALKPNDTYARKEGDTRPVFRSHPARSKEDFRRLPHNVERGAVPAQTNQETLAAMAGGSGRPMRTHAVATRQGITDLDRGEGVGMVREGSRFTSNFQPSTSLRHNTSVESRRTMASPQLSRISGRYTKASWSQESTAEPSSVDFNLTRQPPRSRLCENQVWKSASRKPISQSERSGSLPYLRPNHYGVSLLT